MQDLGSLSVRLGKGGGLGSFNVGSGQGGMSCVVSPLCLSAVFNPLQMDDALRSSLLLAAPAASVGLGATCSLGRWSVSF